jgi:hypothetical protein
MSLCKADHRRSLMTVLRVLRKAIFEATRTTVVERAEGVYGRGTVLSE